MAWVSWKYSEENIAAEKNVNAAVAYVTTQALLKLYEYLSQLGVSVILRYRLGNYIQKVDETPKVKTGLSG